MKNNQHYQKALAEQIRKRQQMPKDYPCCMKSDCSLFHECRHGILYRQAGGTARTLHILNPKHLSYTGDLCPHFRHKDALENWAIGFEQGIQRMNLDEKYRFQRRCVPNYFRKTYYYELRSGKHLISPTDQALLCQAAQDEGIVLPSPFYDHVVAIPRW